ncbi:MAG: class I SAM-dependent methyltransferase, partial [Dongiaceae bacterium]
MTTAPACRLCAAPLTRSFLDLGEMPLANAFQPPEQLTRPEPRYPLHARVCERCLLVQVDAVVRREEIFEDYAYFSSYSSSWVEHAHRFAQDSVERFGLDSKSLVVEVASNDGYLLKHFVALG